MLLIDGLVLTVSFTYKISYNVIRSNLIKSNLFIIFIILGKKRLVNKGVGYRKRKISDGVDVIYIRKTGVGVRRDSVIHMILPEKRNELKYSRPCVCGSLTHHSTRSLNCWLNKRYIDV